MWNSDQRGDGQVDQDVAHPLHQLVGLVVGHAGQHLDRDRSVELLANRQRIGQIEQIVGGHADVGDSNGGCHDELLEEPLVGRVGLRLGRIGGRWPAVLLGFHAFHRQVCTFDQSDPDRCAACRLPGPGPVEQDLERWVAVGYVRLDGDARREPGKFGLTEDAGE